MPEMLEQMYCSQQIVIPPKFPYILKRYCKAAIKTQPYDLLRWSFEYFRALADHRPPPVKLRLEYPIYSTEGGLTKGCLKVLANQLEGQNEVPLIKAKEAWQGFCLDPEELVRILCLCEVHCRSDFVPYLHLIAVAAGFLTKSLTHTMILLCETLTKEPDGGSAAIPVGWFLTMYKFLARMDASKDVRYINGYREGFQPPQPVEEEVEKGPETIPETFVQDDSEFPDDASVEKQSLSLIGDHVVLSSKISTVVNRPLLGQISRSPSVEMASNMEKDKYLMSRKGKYRPDDNVNEKLRRMSASLEAGSKADMEDDQEKPKKEQLSTLKQETLFGEEVEIHVYDEEDNPLPLEFYGEPTGDQLEEEDDWDTAMDPFSVSGEDKVGEEMETEKLKIKKYVEACFEARENRRRDLQETFEELAAIVDKFKHTNYDLGMVAGRQLSITSGEFIVQTIQKEIIDHINEQIAILPDPAMKRQKATQEEVEGIREMLDFFVDSIIDHVGTPVEEVEEEEAAMPDIVTVYAVPGIGPPVDDEIIREFEEYALDVTKVQADVFMPRNIRHFMCPPLEKYEEYNYDEDRKEGSLKKKLKKHESKTHIHRIKITRS